MPKEPQPSHAYTATSSSAPYTKNVTALTSTAGHGGSSSSGSPTGPPRLTINNVTSFRPRVKKLPPDANTKAAVSTQLYQFPEQVCFGCVKCKRDNIKSDCLAIDLKNRIMLCTACFTRIIRPRTYTPSRVVPFPSLLSWLNYKPATVMEVAEDVLERPAEVVAPSGERMAAPTLTGGDRATNLGKLPAIAMRVAPAGAGRGRRGGTTAAAATTMDDALALGSVAAAGAHATHPCLRVWGVCQHGETCLFRNAPGDLCLAYLMGLCRGYGSPLGQGHYNHHINRGGRGGRGGGGGGGGRGRGRGGPGGRGFSHNSHNNRRGGGNFNAHSRNHYNANSSHYVQHTCRLLHQEVYDLPSTSDPAPPVRYEGDLEDEEGEWATWVRHRRESPNSAEWQLWHNGPLEHLFRAYVPARRRPLPPKPRSEAGTEDTQEAEGEARVHAGEEEVDEGDGAVAAVADEGNEERDNSEGDENVGGEEREDEEAEGGQGEEEEQQQQGEEEEQQQQQEEEEAEEEEAEEEDEEDDVPPPPEPQPTKLSLLDIMAALKGMKKEPASSAPSVQPGSEE